MNTNNCDLKRIEDFFDDEEGKSSSELAQHLDACEACRKYFDEQAAQPSLWLEAQQLLRPTEYDLASSTLFSAGGEEHWAGKKKPSIESVLESLVAAEDPHRLGRLGTYEVSGVVGAGGMGVVLKAIDPSLDRVVAIKVLAPHLANNPTARKRFSREAKAAAAVLHPNVIAIHSVSSDAPLPYLVMAYIRGGSLQKRLDHHGPLSTVEILRIGSQVAAGLAAAHEQGLIHRDVKPENILLEEGVERVTLTDFGLARAVDDTSVTYEGTIAGTPQYMSPEQARGESVDQRSDLFSLGSVLYALCTGRAPFRADSSYGVMRRISDDHPTPIRDLSPDIPPWLESIVEKLMAKKKSQRFQSAAEVRELLETCLHYLQQPGAISLPLWLTKKENSRWFTNPFTTTSRTVGFFSMLGLLTAIALGICYYPATVGFLPQAGETLNQESNDGEVLGHGYVRKGDYIFFEGQRIDEAGKDDVDEFAEFIERRLDLAADVDAASFKVLSEEYTKDKNRVYYKHTSPGRFWVVALPNADVSSFEVVGFNLAKDKNHAWWDGETLPGVDPQTVALVNEGFVWKDANKVWYQHEIIPEADPQSFRHLEQAFYSDRRRVYWSGEPLPNADPATFRTFGDDCPYGADQATVWKASTLVTGVDAGSFEAIHQTVYKDKNAVYADGYPVVAADPTTFRRVANLDEHFSALLADNENFYVYLPYRGEIYLVLPSQDSLSVKRQIWAPGTPRHRPAEVEPVAISSAELSTSGWKNQQVVVDESIQASQMIKDQEASLLDLYESQFLKAWRIIQAGEFSTSAVNGKANFEPATQGSAQASNWQSDFAAFNRYLHELAAAGTVPDKSSLAKRVTLVPGDEGNSIKSEVIPVTDGAGGYIDLQPAQDTVQFQVNEALKGRKVQWEFELGRDAVETYTGLVSLFPKIVRENDAVGILGSLFIRYDAKETVAAELRAGDIVKLEGTIGDFAENAGRQSLDSHAGAVAIYHLDSAPSTVFYIGLTKVAIASPDRNRDSVVKDPSTDVATVAKRLLKATLSYDEKQLEAIYAPQVRLLPGNRLFHYGLEFPGKMTAFGAVVDRGEMLPALKKQADRDPVPDMLVGGLVNLFQIEQLNVAAGEFAIAPNQQGESVFAKLRFTIDEGDVLLQLSVPGVRRYLQLRRSGEQWQVVAEY